MIKMYNAEVLSKFPVVQHFPFGSLFSWTPDPNVPAPSTSVHTANQPSSQSSAVSGKTQAASMSRLKSRGESKAPLTATEASIRGLQPGEALQAPWTKSSTSARQGMMPSTTAPWAKQATSESAASNVAMTRAPWASRGTTPSSTVPTRAPRSDLLDRTSQTKR